MTVFEKFVIRIFMVVAYALSRDNTFALTRLSIIEKDLNTWSGDNENTTA